MEWAGLLKEVLKVTTLVQRIKMCRGHNIEAEDSVGFASDPAGSSSTLGLGAV